MQYYTSRRKFLFLIQLQANFMLEKNKRYVELLRSISNPKALYFHANRYNSQLTKYYIRII